MGKKNYYEEERTRKKIKPSNRSQLKQYLREKIKETEKFSTEEFDYHETNKEYGSRSLYY